MKEKRICQVCQKEFPRSSMRWTQDCHGIPFRLVCGGCYAKIMEEKAMIKTKDLKRHCSQRVLQL